MNKRRQTLGTMERPSLAVFLWLLLLTCQYVSCQLPHVDEDIVSGGDKDGQDWMLVESLVESTDETTPGTVEPTTAAPAPGTNHSLSSDPNLRTCSGPNDDCMCHFTGTWNLREEYSELKILRRQADELTDDISELDVNLVKDNMNTIQERIHALKERIYTQKVSLSVRGLFDIQKSVDIMRNLVDQLDLNSTSNEVIKLLQDELNSLTDIINDLWSRHPTLDLTELTKKVQELETRLANCRENYNFSYFRGDTLPVNVEDDGWCDEYEFVGVGDAVAHRFESHSYWAKGNFMKDPYPQTEANRTMIFMRNYVGDGTSSTYYTNYNRYRNYTEFIGKINEEAIMNRLTRGDGFTVYKGAIYDHTRDNKINRYVLTAGSWTKVAFSSTATKYFKQVSDTYVDFKADETGLYVIYALTSFNDDRLIISQLDPSDLGRIKDWKTSRHKNSVCAAFMICGKLHTIDNCWSRVPPSNSNKQFVYDTTTGEETEIRLHIPSKFGFIHQLSYNSREREIFGWDNGHLVTYPIIWKPKAPAT